MSKKKLSQCYLCGIIETGLTIEHLPPKCLSPKSADSEFATISACQNCNNKYSHEESKFRDFVATAGSGRGLIAADEAYGAMKRNFARNPIGRAGNPHKDLIRLIKNIKRRDFYTPSGKVYLGSSNVVTPPDDLDLEGVLLKIARGLHFLYTGAVIPDDYIKHAVLIEKIEYPELYEETNTRGRAGDFFHFRGGWAKEDIKSGLWYMVFYKRVGAMAWFLNSTAIKKTSKHKPKID